MREDGVPGVFVEQADVVAVVPELIFTGGRVLDAAATATLPAVLAVANGRISAIGGSEVLATRGPRTEVVELAGRCVLPGFTDAHVHPVQGGLERLRCDLSDVLTRADYLTRIAEYARANPGADWILGGGWAMAQFPGGTPTAADLDAVVADRPVFLVNRDHHGAWVNSRALALAGIDASTPDPSDGRIERTAVGHPTGTLHEGAMSLVMRHVPTDTAEQMLQGLLGAQEYLHSLGITGWQDAILGSYSNITDAGEVYLQAHDTGQLTARVVAAQWWDRDRGSEQIEGFVARREQLQRANFRATSVKIMQDGVAENFTAAMLEPYFDGCGCRAAGAGLSFVDPVALAGDVSALDRAGFQVHVHAIGDRAVREALDAFARARTDNGGNDLRHHIAHVQVVHPQDIPRFAELGVGVNMQALWAAYEPQMTELTIPFLGEQRAGWQYPFADFARSGAPLCAGSDWPVSSPDPWAAIHVAVNRTLPADTPDATLRAFLPHQALTLAQVLRAYTAGSARINHLDDGGVLEVGRLADLAVIDRDPFATPAGELGQIRNLATYVGGHLVHQTS